MRNYNDIFVRKDGSFFPVVCAVAPLEQDNKVGSSSSHLYPYP